MDPPFRVAQEDSFGPAIQHADEDTLARRALFSVDGRGKLLQPSLGVNSCVFTQLRLDDLVITLCKRRRGEQIGDQHHGERAADEQRGVPHGKAQPESARKVGAVRHRRGLRYGRDPSVTE